MIRVIGRTEGDWAVISVIDQGIGIPQEEREKLFRRFYRVDNRLRRETQGAGLGLFLSRAIVEAHGGRMWVESRVGRGSRFSFTIPLATMQLTDLESDDQRTEISRYTPIPEGPRQPQIAARPPTDNPLLPLLPTDDES
jgi:signal transduction histidine kinase